MESLQCSSDSKDTDFRPFRATDIPQVVDIHLKILEEDFVARLGHRFLERAIYPTMLHPASTGFGFVQVRNGKVVGFIVGMLNPQAWHWTLVRTRGFECLLATARTCFSGWSNLLQIVRTVRQVASGQSIEGGGRLFSLAIENAYQGRGLGVKLIDSFLDHCFSHGLSRCSVRTSKDNLPARRLYAHLGFREELEFTIHERTFVAYGFDFGTPDDAEEEGLSKTMAATPGRLPEAFRLGKESFVDAPPGHDSATPAVRRKGTS